VLGDVIERANVHVLIDPDMLDHIEH